jgi:hypothetical protein
MKHLMTILTALTRRRQPTEAGQTAQIAALTGDQQQLLDLRWWRYRHVFLEMKRLQLEQRRDH